MLVWALVDGIREHRPRCASCARVETEGGSCAHIRAATHTVIEWLTGRELLSRARWFRYRRDLLEIELERRRLEET